uniref:Uncharacterized protein n=1 Tax=Megaselia scalaris TaxID=36166 RepID=T1GM07_MEGSC
MFDRKTKILTRKPTHFELTKNINVDIRSIIYNSNTFVRLSGVGSMVDLGLKRKTLERALLDERPSGTDTEAIETCGEGLTDYEVAAMR